MTATNAPAAFDLSETTFGVEIETHIPGATIPVGRYHGGVAVDAMPGWKVERDGSIDVPATRVAAEFISPVLKGADGLRQVIKAIEYIKSIGGKVNASCGFHVHVGWGGDEKALKRLVSTVAYHEKGLYAATGTRTREDGHYCKTVRENGKMVNKFRDNQPESFDHCDRYSILNLTNLTSRPAVEFRVFSGTLNATKAIAFIRMALGLVEKAMTARRGPEWSPAQKAAECCFARKAGEGQSELTRLLYGIGWIRGKQSRIYGNLGDDSIPALAECRAELVRLARKYDGIGEVA